MHGDEPFQIIHVDDSQDFDDLFDASQENVEYWTVTITNGNSNVEADIDQCKEDLSKIQRALFDLCVEQDTTVPPLCDFIQEWIRRHMEIVERTD